MAWMAWLGSGCSREPLERLNLIELYDTASIKAETRGITFGNDPSVGCLSSGFSRLETDPEGRDFIWGTGNVSLVEPFLLSRADRYLTFTIRPFYPKKVGTQDLRIVWNGESVGEFKLKESAWKDYRVEIPGNIQQIGPNLLEFRFSEAGIPAEIIQGSSDVRQLSAAFDALLLEPKPEFHSGLPVPVNWPRIENREGRSILTFPGPAQVSYHLACPPNTGLHFYWMTNSQEISDNDTAVSVVCSSEGNERTLYRGNAKKGRTEWAKAGFSIPYSDKPVTIQIQVHSGDVEILDLHLHLFKEVDLTDLLGYEDVGDTGLSPEDSSPGEAPTPGVRSTEKPNLIFLLIDALRADHVTAYGYDRPTTPHLSEMANRGVLYERALAQSSWTKYSMAAIMTGRHPSSCRTWEKNSAVPPAAITLAEALSQSGYYCAAFSTNLLMSKEYGLDQGFDEFHQFPEKWDTEKVHVLSAELYDAVIASLDPLRSKSPFFLYVHSTDPHAPYTPPSAFREAFGRADKSRIAPTLANLEKVRNGSLTLSKADIEYFIDLYDAEIASNDFEIGRLLDELGSRGLLSNGILVITADHGEEFLEHGSTEHSHNLYEEVLHVPLILRFPGCQEGVRIPARVSQIDLFPTLTYLCGAENPEGLEGRILPGLDGKIDGTWKPKYHFAELYTKGIISLETEEEKVIVNLRRPDSSNWLRPDVELFDKASDKNDGLNLSRRDLSRTEHLAASCRALWRIYREKGRALGEEQPAATTEEHNEALSRLGYLN